MPTTTWTANQQPRECIGHFIANFGLLGAHVVVANGDVDHLATINDAMVIMLWP